MELQEKCRVSNVNDSNVVSNDVLINNNENSNTEDVTESSENNTILCFKEEGNI